MSFNIFSSESIFELLIIIFVLFLLLRITLSYTSIFSLCAYHIRYMIHLILIHVN